MTDKEFFNKNLTLSFEFSRYIIAHPEVEEKISKGALVILLLEDDPEFNRRAMELAQTKKEENQPVVIVRVQKPLPPYGVSSRQSKIGIGLKSLNLYHVVRLQQILLLPLSPNQRSNMEDPVEM